MNYSRIIGEALMEVVNPAVMVSRLDLVVLDSAAVSRVLGVFIEQRGGPGAPEVGTTHQGAPGPPGAPWWVVPSFGPPRCNQGPISSFWSIKNLRKVSWHLDSV